MRSVKRIVGYVILFILSLVPALVGYMYEAGANEIGMPVLGSLCFTQNASPTRSKYF